MVMRAAAKTDHLNEEAYALAIIGHHFTEASLAASAAPAWPAAAAPDTFAAMMQSGCSAAASARTCSASRYCTGFAPARRWPPGLTRHWPLRVNILGQIEGGETAPDIRNARTLLAELV
jgi:hypothetical protein